MGSDPVDPDRKPATAARIYDYALGGAHNFAADRAAAAALYNALPEGDAWMVARANRAFLQRDLALQLQAVDIGKLDIEDEARGKVRLVCADIVAGGSEQRRPDPVGLEQFAQRLAQSLVIVDDEHDGIVNDHGPLSLRQGV